MACGRILLGETAWPMVRDGSLPKGDPLRLAEAVSYDLHPVLCGNVFREIADEAQAQWGPETRLWLTHRHGRLAIGEAGVLGPLVPIIHDPAYCDDSRPRICGVSLGRGSSSYRPVRLQPARSRNTPSTEPGAVSLRPGHE